MWNDQRVLAIIPARGGSKRVPDKNIRPLGGVPLLAHSIRAAKQSRYIDVVVVSTESERIGTVAAQFGACVLPRPPILAQDTTPTEPVLVHVLDEWRRRGEGVDIVVLLQPTSPLRTAADIDQAITTFGSGAYDTVISVTPFLGYWYERGAEGALMPRYVTRGRSQDRVPEYVENGAIYVARAALVRGGTLIGERIGAQEMDARRSVDIDTEEDFSFAEYTLRALSPTRFPERVSPESQ